MGTPMTFAELDARRAEGRPSPTSVVMAGERLHQLLDVHDPLVQAFRRKRAGTLRGVDDVLGQQREMAVSFLEGSHGLNSASYEDRVPIAYQIHAAVPFLWQPDMVRTAMEGRLPPHVIGRDQLMHPVMWWTMPDVYVAPDGSGRGIAGILLIDFGDYFRVMFVMQSVDATMTLGHVTFRYGDRFPDSFAGTDEDAGTILKMLSFLNSPYIPIHAEALSRQVSRGLARKGWEEQTKVVFVDLRAAEQAASRHTTGTGTVEWKHRWIVRGHHRAQWYPSIQAHKVIWIAPFVKGPDGASLKPPVYRVAR